MSLLSYLDGAQQKALRVSGGCHNCPRRRVEFRQPTLPKTEVIVLTDVPVPHEELVGSLGRAGFVEPFASTSVVHCVPKTELTAASKEIACCLSQYVLDEIRDYSWVVFLGTTPLTAFFPRASGTRFRGNVAHHPDFPGQRFYTMYSPGYVGRRPAMRGELEQQAQRLGRLVRGEDTPLTWRLVDPSQGAHFEEALTQVLQASLVSFDVEGNRLDTWHPSARMTSLAVTADGDTVVTVAREDAAWLWAISQVGTYLSDARKHVLGANIGFDLVFAEAEWGIRARCQKHDVLSLYYELGRYKQPSLKHLASREGEGYRNLVHLPFAGLDPQRDALYNAEDVVHPLVLYRKGMREASAKTRDLVTRVSSPAGYVLRRVTQCGIYMRATYRQQQIEEHVDARRQIVAVWKKEDPAFIPVEHESGHGLERYLFEVKGLVPTGHTEKGTRSTSKTALKEWIRGGASYLRHLVALREIDKVLSTYLTAYDKHVRVDGRIHTQYTTTWTDTGRPSSKEPNLQNIPRKKKIRNLFGPTPGWILSESDFSQIEFRIMISLARDLAGIAGYNRGLDAHRMTAQSFSSADPTEEERSRAKAINFALLYGGNWRNIQRTARDWFGVEWSKARCQEFEAGFWATYPGMKPFHARCAEELIARRGWFESVLGHCHYYEEWDHEDRGRREHTFRAALNATAQGPAGELCFYTMIQADTLWEAAGIPARFVNTVHDSMLWEVPGAEWVAPAVEVLEEAVTRTHDWIRPWFPVPLVLDHKVGHEGWGSLTTYTVPRGTEKEGAHLTL